MHLFERVFKSKIYGEQDPIPKIRLARMVVFIRTDSEDNNDLCERLLDAKTDWLNGRPRRFRTDNNTCYNLYVNKNINRIKN